MSARDRDVVLQEIARLWSELQATPMRHPKHAELMEEIHAQSATYLIMIEEERGLDQVSKPRKAPKPSKAPKASRASRHEK
jgi:hypothetical protein